MIKLAVCIEISIQVSRGYIPASFDVNRICLFGKRRVVDRFELDRYVESRNAEAKAALEISGSRNASGVRLWPVGTILNSYEMSLACINIDVPL